MFDVVVVVVPDGFVVAVLVVFVFAVVVLDVAGSAVGLIISEDSVFPGARLSSGSVSNPLCGAGRGVGDTWSTSGVFSGSKTPSSDVCQLIRHNTV